MTLRFFVFVVMTGLQPQHIRHAVATGFFAVEPLGSFERTMDKHVTTECLVGQFEFFTEVGKEGGVTTDFRTHTQGMHADLTTLTLDIIAVTTVDNILDDVLAGGFADGFGNTHGSA